MRRKGGGECLLYVTARERHFRGRERQRNPLAAEHMAVQDEIRGNPVVALTPHDAAYLFDRFVDYMKERK